MPEATGYMIVDQTCCLKVRVDDGRANEAEAATDEVATDLVRQGRLGRHTVKARPAIHEWVVIHKAPDVAIEAAKLALDSDKPSRVGDRGTDLSRVPNNARIGHQLLDFALVVSGHNHGVELSVEPTVVRSPLENCQPAQARLRGLQNEKLEMLPVVVNRDRPFLVVVPYVQFVVQTPGTSFHVLTDLSAEQSSPDSVVYVFKDTRDPSPGSSKDDHSQTGPIPSYAQARSG